jgi:hypothetical protein
MRKISMLIGGLAMMGTTLVTAAPRATTPQTTMPRTVMTQLSQPLPWEPQQTTKTVCNLLCIQGYHCCIIHNKATCVPETQACP